MSCLPAIGFYASANSNNANSVLADPYFNTVRLLMPFEGVNESTIFTDLKGHHFTSSNAVISASNYKYGSSSAFFNGSNSFITTPHSSDFNIGSIDFTIEFYVNFSSIAGSQSFFNKYGSDDNSLGYQFLHYGGDTIEFATQWVGNDWFWIPTTGIWYHVALTRFKTTMYCFVDGLSLPIHSGSTATRNNFPDNSYSFQIGRLNHSEAQYWYPVSGYIDEFRLTTEVARYTSDFTPLVTPFSNF